ncbi:Hypothetical protein FKW44_001473 [Caligus rogercresseyi]|uniref:Uncharacterized protein n=1 Tax=Caligus rogercresseyi TaxID=217165 RepID=A0A7T8KIT0_CALRO|nr:Hypothetical protein FKW44_001473 [Caligus rogercresseyi]
MQTIVEPESVRNLHQRSGSGELSPQDLPPMIPTSAMPQGANAPHVGSCLRANTHCEPSPAAWG